MAVEGKIPKEWKTGITIPIFKKGENNPVNYRGITTKLNDENIHKHNKNNHRKMA